MADPATPRGGVRVVRQSGMSGSLRRPGQPPRVRLRRWLLATFDLVIVGGGNMGAALAGGLLAGGIVAAGPARRRRGARRPPRRNSPTCCPACTSPTPSRRARRRCSPSSRPTCPMPRPRRSPPVPAACCRSPPGCTIRQIERAAAGVTADPVAVIRAMPNTPALVGEGASAISGGSAATDDDLAWAEAILGGVGLVVRVAEARPRRRHRAQRVRAGLRVPRRRGADRRGRRRRTVARAGVDADDAAARRLGERCSPSAATRQPCG